jgi:hypothetical protein
MQMGRQPGGNGAYQMVHRRERLNYKQLGTRTLPASATRPMSLRIRSTIIKFSARSLGERASFSA